MSFVIDAMVANSFTQGLFTNKYIKLDDGKIEAIEANAQQGVQGVTAGTHIKIVNLFSGNLFKMNNDANVAEEEINNAISADRTPNDENFNGALTTLKTKQTEAQEAAQKEAAQAGQAQTEIQKAAAQKTVQDAQTAALKNAVGTLMPSGQKDKVLYAGLCFPVDKDKIRMKAVKRTIVLLKLLISANYSNSEDIDTLLNRAGIMQLIMIKELELGVVPTGNSAGLLALKAQVKLMLDKQYNSVFATTGWSRPEILKTEMAEVGKKYNKYKSKYLALKNQ